MIGLQTHIICHTRTTTLKINIGTLIVVSFLKNQIIPIHIRVYIRIQSFFSIQNLFFRIFRIRDRSQTSSLSRFIVSTHKGRSVCKFHYIHRTEVRCLQRNIYLRFWVFRTTFCSNQHHTIRTSVTVNSRCRSIFQQRKTFDRFCRNTVQVRGWNFHSIQQNQWGRTSSECIDTTDIKFRRRSRFSTACHRHNTS